MSDEAQKIVKRWKREAMKAGWKARPAKGGHVFLYPPNGGPPVTMGGNPGPRNLHNVRAAFRRSGLEVHL